MLTANSLARRSLKRAGLPIQVEDQRHKYIDDPMAFAGEHFKIMSKQGEIVPLRFNAAQRDFAAKRTRRDLILKARQLGFSTYIQADIFGRSLDKTVLSLTLTHDDKLTHSLREMVKLYFDELPDDIRPKREYSNAVETTYPTTHSRCEIVTAGNKQSGRGSTRTILHGTEVAFWPDAKAIMSGALQAGDPQWVVLESTANGAQGYFYNLCMEALDGNNDWTLHFYPWWWEPGYAIPLDDGETLSYDDEEQALVEKYHLKPEQIKWRRTKKRELKDQFAQEYAEDPHTCFLQSGNGYFGDLSLCWTAPYGAEPHPDHRYLAGMDFGQTNDYTAVSVIDVTTRRQVAFERWNRMQWKDMRLNAIRLCKHWGVQVLVAEQNSMGSTNIEEMYREMEAEKATFALQPFETTNESKTSIMSDMHEALHSGTLKLLPDPVQKHEFGAFISKQLPSGAWRLAAQGDEHDDAVICNGLAWSRVGRGIGIWF